MKRTAVRRVVWILVGLLVYAVLSALGVASNRAFAQAPTNPCGNVARGCSMQEARAACDAWVAYEQATNPQRNPVCQGPYTGVTGSNPWTGTGPGWFYGRRTGGVFFNSAFTNSDCPVGSVFRPDLGRCFDESECQARNQEEGFLNVGSVVKPFSSRCIAGCRYSSSDAQCTTVSGSVQQQCTGNFQWGASCTADPPGPDEPFIPSTYDTPEGTAEEVKKDQRCIPVSGQNVCLKKNGEVCYSSATTGRQFCWRTSETGEKNDDQTRQIRRAGENEIPPANPNLPSGDVLEKSGQSVTTTTTGSNSTTTTTTTNYVTQHGTQPGPGNDSEPDDGSGKEPGEGEDDKGDVTGGGDCEIPPIVRGGDPIAGAVLEQTWETRCAVEAGNAAKVTGDINKCHEPFTVEGTNANAVKLRAMREQICKEGERTENEGISTGLEAITNAMEGEYSVSDIWGDGSGTGDGISTTRYGGGGACPVIEVNIPVLGMTWTPPAFFCDLIAALRLLFLTVATIWALRIIGS